MVTTRHLTQPERDALAILYNSCDRYELLQCIAGLVSHNVADYGKSQDAASLIRQAANIIGHGD